MLVGAGAGIEGRYKGGDIPAESLEETVIIAVDFEDLDSLVGGAGLEVLTERERWRRGGRRTARRLP